MVQKSFSLKHLTSEEDKIEGAKLLAKSFYELNGVYKNFDTSVQGLYPVFYKRIEASMEKQLASAFLIDGKMMGIALGYEFYDYYNLRTAYNAEFMGVLRKYGDQVETPLKDIKPIKGEAVHGGSGALLPQVANKGYGLWFAIQRLKYYQSKGFKVYYGKLLSPASFNMLKKVGAQELKRVRFEEQQFKDEYYYLVKIDLSGKIPQYRDVLAQQKQKSKL